MNAPEWLAELQRRFGEALRTPLDRSTGTLRATEAYPDLDVTRPSRLAAYNRQYWFRLFTVLQESHPLTCSLLGAWAFNEHAARYLLTAPPRTHDLEDVADGFVERFEAPSPLLSEAARIDAAHRRTFGAELVVPYRPSAADAERLPQSRLCWAPSLSIVEEHWALVELRSSLDGPSERPVAPPLAHPEARSWAFLRRPEGVLRVELEPEEATLLELLGRHTVEEALFHLEETSADRDALPEATRRWLSRAVSLGFFAGIAPQPG